MLAVSIRLDLIELSELMTQIGAAGHHPEAPPTGIVSTRLEGDLAGATIRLLEALTVPLDAQVLGPGI
ncbi:AraC family transcriptional regulator N-terminal domain-containing protein, partial [Burkholderia sp. SIMBA_019]